MARLRVPFERSKNCAHGYSEAIPLAQRTSAIVKKALGRDHPDVASAESRNDALEQALKINAEIVKLFNVGRYADAIPLAQLELAIYEKVLGPNHLDVATSLNTLAFFYEKQGRYADAEPLYKRAAAIREKALGPDDPFVGSLLSTLAAIYNNQKRDTEAEPLQKRALAISEEAYGPNDPAVALRLYSLASTYFNQGRYADAALVQTRSGNMRESVWSRSSQRRCVARPTAPSPPSDRACQSPQ
jgi:tetratricopeptide (TPR) repeat protein